MATDATGTPTSPDNIARILPSDAPAVTTLTSGVNAIADTVQTALTNNYLRKTSGNIVNADINAAAAIAYSKLNLAGGIVNNDVNASAAIAYSKLNLTGAVQNADLAGSIAVSKLAAGTDRQVLWNSGGTNQWARYQGTAHNQYTPNSGTDFVTPPGIFSGSGHSPTLNTTYYCPLFIPFGGTYDQIMFDIATGAASSVVRAGIFDMSTRGIPQTLIVDAGTVSTATSGIKTVTIGSPPTLVENRSYFIALTLQTATGVTWYGHFYSSGQVIQSTSLTGRGSTIGFSQSGVSGAYSASAGGVSNEGVSSTNSQLPWCALRKA